MRFLTLVLLGVLAAGCAPAFEAERSLPGEASDPELGVFRTTLELERRSMEMQQTPDEVAATALAAVQAFALYDETLPVEAAADCVRDTLVRVAEPKTFQESCFLPDGHNVLGCTLPWSSEIYLLEDSGYNCENFIPVIGHEFLHRIADCLMMDGQANAEHRLPGVFAIDPDDGVEGFNEDSAEGLLAYHPTNFCGGVDPGVGIVAFED